jgi:hypothetical protein
MVVGLISILFGIILGLEKGIRHRFLLLIATDLGLGVLGMAIFVKNCTQDFGEESINFFALNSCFIACVIICFIASSIVFTILRLRQAAKNIRSLAGNSELT